MADKRSALIVASDQYSDPKLTRLRSPSTDAAELARVLGDPAIGNFTVSLSMNETEALVRRRLSSFFTTAGREDLLLLHVACHGVKDDDGNLYFATTDTETAALLATAVSADFVRQLLDRTLSRRVVVLLDCCYSGAFARGTRADPDVHVLERFQPARAQHAAGRGRAVITASSATEYAWEGDDIKGEGLPSVFTSAVVRGLKTGEADRDGDGHISVDDLYDYVLEKVREATPKQTPNRQIQLEGELIIAESVRGPRATSGDLPSELLETVRDARPWVREGGVAELGRLLQGSDPRLARAAEAALKDLAEDDSRRVSDAAAKMLADIAELRRQRELAALYTEAQARERLTHQGKRARQEQGRQEETTHGPPSASISDTVSKVPQRHGRPSGRARRADLQSYRVSFMATRDFRAASLQDAIRQAEALGATEIASVTRGE